MFGYFDNHIEIDEWKISNLKILEKKEISSTQIIVAELIY